MAHSIDASAGGLDRPVVERPRGIQRGLAHGDRRLARNLRIPRPTLSARLRTLVDAGLLERVLYPQDPDRHEYRLSSAGRDLFPAIVTLMRWGDEHLAGPEGPPIVLRHDTCGKLADPRLTCQHSGQEIHVHDVTPEPGPGFRDPEPAEGLS